MNDTPTQQTADVIQPIQPKKNGTEEKWGREVMQHGHTTIPALLLRSQQRLGLNPTQLAVLLQLMDYWWDQDRKPYPSKQSLSDRLGLKPRQIQRHIADLEKAGLVQRIERTATHRGKISNEYDLSGLVERLKKLEPEFRKVKEMQRQVSRKGGLNRRKQAEHLTP